VVAVSISQALTDLDTAPPDCAAIVSTRNAIDEAKSAQVPTIAYAKTHDEAEYQLQVGAATFAYSLADLALRLRAHEIDQRM
jgi:beta-phosphoglucomutase-like phosphatase (HAD superfamily)